MNYNRMPIEVESPEELGYNSIQYNLAESSIRDISYQDLNINLNDLILCYGEHRGTEELRNLIIRNEDNLSCKDVLVCPSAATALFIIATTLLSKEDHLIVIRPNYATNIETPRAIGCSISIVDTCFEDEFQCSIDAILQHIQPNTKLISLTSPHNPTGIILEDDVVKKIIQIAKEKNIYVLIDETYRYLNFQTERLPYYANYDPHVISVCSQSKAFGVPGIRIGWLICKHPTLMNQFLAAKEQIIICNSVVDEAIATHIFKQEEQLIAKTHQHIKENYNYLISFLREQEYLEWVSPKVGVVIFPRIKSIYTIDTEKFYKLLYEEYKTIVGAGHWFEMPDTYMRVGFGYPTLNELQQGLKNIIVAIQQAQV